MGSRRHPLWDGRGAGDFGGRWNPPGIAVIYAASSLALAMIERLVQRRALADTVYVEAEVPDDASVEDVTASPPDGWADPGYSAGQAFGRAWVEEGRSALLLVPSVVVRREKNVVVNPAHPDASRIRVGPLQHRSTTAHGSAFCS